MRGGREGGTGPEGLRLAQGPEGVGVAVSRGPQAKAAHQSAGWSGSGRALVPAMPSPGGASGKHGLGPSTVALSDSWALSKPFLVLSVYRVSLMPERLRRAPP